MPFTNFNKLEKMKILAFRHADRTGIFEFIEVMFNPDSYSQTYSNLFQKKQGINFVGSESSYSITKPETLKFDLILDSTGASEYGYKKATIKPVYDQVQDFLKKCYYMKGTTHQPAFLQVKWGRMVFDGRLEEVKINYEMFDLSGVPMRAKLEVCITGNVKDPSGANIKNSPDLTHFRVVKAGETLPMLSMEIYGTPDYYLDIAEINGINHCRKLEPGIELKFPPLEQV